MGICKSSYSNSIKKKNQNIIYKKSEKKNQKAKLLNDENNDNKETESKESEIKDNESKNNENKNNENKGNENKNHENNIIVIKTNKNNIGNINSYLVQEENFKENFFDKDKLILSYNKNMNIIKINVPAIIGEIEYPIYFKPNSKIEISVAKFKYTWSFLQDEDDNITIDGYKDNYLNKYKIGQLLFRTSNSNEFKPISHKNKTNYIIDKFGGTLLIHANVDYEDDEIIPNGNVELNIVGGILKDYFECIKLDFPITEEAEKRCKNNNSCEITILRYINMARLNPQKFFQNYIKNFDTKNTSEFEKIVQELTPLYELHMLPSLSKSALDHCLDLGIYGTTGLNSTNNFDTLKTRIDKYCDVNYIGGNTYFGSNNPLLIVRQMILDRNQPMSKNRNNIYNSEFIGIGISVRTHIKNKYGCVIVFGK